MSTPQSITSIRRGWPGSRSARYSDTQITAAARPTTRRVSPPTSGTVPTLATSCPCAVITNGAPAAIATSPVGTR